MLCPQKKPPSPAVPVPPLKVASSTTPVCLPSELLDSTACGLKCHQLSLSGEEATVKYHSFTQMLKSEIELRRVLGFLDSFEADL
jgi:hypothetical protein